MSSNLPSALDDAQEHDFLYSITTLFTDGLFENINVSNSNNDLDSSASTKSILKLENKDSTTCIYEPVCSNYFPAKYLSQDSSKHLINCFIGVITLDERTEGKKISMIINYKDTCRDGSVKSTESRQG